MGRFTALAAAPAVIEKSKHRHTPGVAAIGQASPSRVRRLTRRTIPDTDRYLRLREIGIQRPAGPLRSYAIDRAALVQAHTRAIDEVTDVTAARVVARYLYDEAIVFGSVDEERALTRPAVDNGFSGMTSFLAVHSASIGQFSMLQAERCTLTNFLSRIVNEDRAARLSRPRACHWRPGCMRLLRTCDRCCARNC